MGAGARGRRFFQFRCLGLGQHRWFSFEYQVGIVESIAIPVDAAGFWVSGFPQVWFEIGRDDAGVCLSSRRFFHPVCSNDQNVLIVGH